MQIEILEGVKGTDLIQDTFLFKFLNFEETLELAGLFRREKVKKGGLIIEEGSLGQALYLIEKGSVKVVKGESEEFLAELSRGELFGEMSLIENELTSASVIATSDVELLVIRRHEFENMLETRLDTALKVYKTFCHTLSERLRKTSQELSRLKAVVPDAVEKKAQAAAPKADKPKAGKKPARRK
jgi:CRP-like cAMP-binding protein